MTGRQLKTVSVMHVSGVSKKTGRAYDKIDLVLENGVILFTYWLNGKDLYIVRNIK